MGILDTIVARKKERLTSARVRTPLGDLKRRVRDLGRTRDFVAAVKRGQGPIKLIAEIKKASPSKGLIRSDFDHRAIAGLYEQEAADAISVLTEEDFFQGRLEFLAEVRQVTTKPLLRKDFIFDEYQVYEARAAYADALLLMASVLGKNHAAELLHLAGELGLSVLFEIHDREELDVALGIGAPVIGINNRNLKTLQIDIETTFRLKGQIPNDKVVISESGIRTREDVLRIESAGLDAMLIGTSLMESPDIAARLRELTGRE